LNGWVLGNIFLAVFHEQPTRLAIVVIIPPEPGMASINCFSKNKPTGIANAGKICTQKVSIMPKLLIIKNRGMVTAIGTNISAIVLTENMVFLSLKFNFERA